MAKRDEASIARTSRLGVEHAWRAVHAHYAELERGLEVRVNENYSRLVVANGNSGEPVHRWFHMKEAYSAQLLHRILKDLGLQEQRALRILDPFSGAGTTVTSVLSLARSGELIRPVAFGIEINPFLHLVGATKAEAVLDPPQDLLGFAQRVAGRAYRDSHCYEVPPLSTFRNGQYFDPSSLQILLRLRAALDEEESLGTEGLLVSLGRVALGACVERTSSLRRDGRALRHIPRPATQDPIDRFLTLVRKMAEDLPTSGAIARARVIHGDGRRLTSLKRSLAPFDLVLCSPPYPNNIDYTEVYKLENWLLGFFTDRASVYAQRQATVHSHPSVRRTVTPAPPPEVQVLTDPITHSLPHDRYLRGRTEMIQGYVLDMYRTLQAARERMRPHAYMVIVVGNSVHGTGPSQVVIAADLLISAAARAAGFAVVRVEVARSLTRRHCSSPYLRESVVILQNAREG